MRKRKKKMHYKTGKFIFITIIWFCVFLCGCDDARKTDMKVAVEINYGMKTEKYEVSSSDNDEITALEAIQHVAKVETIPAGNYVFVSSINDVKGEKNINAWYYEVNGEPAKILAINNKLKTGDKVTWIYRKDVCSRLVNNK
jgi:hypothetical protein